MPSLAQGLVASRRRPGVRESTTDTVHLPSGSLAYAAGVVVGVAAGVVAGALLLSALFLVYLTA